MQKIKKNYSYKEQLDHVLDLYEIEFKKYGYSTKSLMWNKADDNVRFKSKFDIGLLDGDSILDVGCGFGHMLDHVNVSNFKSIKYTGVDICPSFLKVAKERHPNADFRLLNILESKINEKWDWVFLVGTFNIAFKESDNWTFIQDMINKMFVLSHKGVACDFLSSYVDFKKDMAYHVDPSKIFQFAKTISKRVAIKHDYMPYEFTVYIYKDDSINDKNIFKEFEATITSSISA